MRVKKAIQLAVEALKEKRHKYAADRHAAELGFEFGKKAMQHYQELTEAMDIIAGLGSQNADEIRRVQPQPDRSPDPMP